MTKGTWEDNNTLLREAYYDYDEDVYYTTSLGYGGKQHTDWALKYFKNFHTYSMRSLYAIKKDDYTIDIYVKDEKGLDLTELGKDLANETEADTEVPSWDECSEDDYCDAMMEI